MSSATSSWEHFAHGADIGIRGFGATAKEAFEQTARAMMAVIAEDTAIEAHQTIELTCSAPTLEDLLFDFLAAIVFEMSVRQMLFADFRVEIEGTRLCARIAGEPIDRNRHELAVEVKGPTYTELCVRFDEHRSRWIAQCVVDV